MSALVLVALFGLTLFVPVFSNDDDEDVAPDTPETPDLPIEEIPIELDDLQGTDGDDVLTVTGTQWANGEAGNDTLNAGVGTQGAVLNGDFGNDVFTVGGDDIGVNGDEGADTIRASGTNGFLNGGLGNDVFDISGSGNVSNADEGNDHFEISGTNNSANGGTGDDTFVVAGAGHTINADEGDDTFSIEANTITVNAGTGADNIFTAEDSFDVTINAEEGNDTLSLAGTNIRADAGLGDDTISYGAASGEVNGGAGDDTINAAGIDYTLQGGTGDDEIIVSGSGTAQGGDGNDTLQAFGSDRGVSGSLFGNAGDDVLSASDNTFAHGGVLLGGGLGADTLTSSANLGLRTDFTGSDALDGNFIAGDTLTGADGSDTFNIKLNLFEQPAGETYIEIDNITDYSRGTDTINILSNNTDASGMVFGGLSVEPSESGEYTDIIATYASTTEGVDPTRAVVRVLGTGDLALSDINLSTGDATTSGTDYISSGGIGAEVDTISGGLGDDLLLHEGRDDAGALVLDGGAGNDTLIASEIEFSNASTLDGGAGDDLLITEIFTQATVETVDTFITGAGEDTIQLSSLWNELGESEFGLIARVTDFSPSEDMIIIDTTPYADATTGDLSQTVTLTENAAENYTDVRVVVTDTDNAIAFTGVVRLEGMTGVSAGGIGVFLSDPAGLPADRPEYLYTATSES